MLGKTVMFWPRSSAVWTAVIGAALLAGFSAGWLAAAREPEARLVTLVASGQTVTGEAIVYPVKAPAKVTAIILTLQPGEETGRHTHGVPGFGYVLEGEVTVDYEGQDSRIYKAGDSILETTAVVHNGRNTGQGPMRILAVFMGAEGMAVSEKVVHQ
jgi:quercetin dioxygenase-like cupin family protein